MNHRNRSDYVLDEILSNETDLEILEHTTDTNGYTDLLFGFFNLVYIPAYKYHRM